MGDKSPKNKESLQRDKLKGKRTEPYQLPLPQKILAIKDR
jgi:hypothetical protein